MNETDTTEEPLYYVLGVYENRDHREEIEWLEEWSRDLRDHSVGFIEPYPIGLRLERLEEPNAVEALCKKSEGFVDYVRRKTNTKNADPYPPIIFVGLGFAALVAMSAVLSEPDYVPMGMIVASVPKDSATGKSVIFQRWYKNLAKQEKLARDRQLAKEKMLAEEEEEFVEKEHANEEEPIAKDPATRRSAFFRRWFRNLGKEEKLYKKEDLVEKEDASEEGDDAREDHSDLSVLKKVLGQFNDRCRRERIRFSYVFRQTEASDDSTLMLSCMRSS